MPIVLGYWDIRGLGQHIRFLLEYGGAEYKEDVYRCGPAPDYDKSGWLSKKFNLGLDFPNLPYLFDRDIKITQSNAIARYIGRKYNLCGKTDKERAMVDMISDQLMDYRNWLVGHFYGNGPSKEIYRENTNKVYAVFEGILNRTLWLCSNEITFPDFHFYEILSENDLYDPEVIKPFPKLKAFMERFENLPKIKSFMSSSRFIKSPVNNKFAVWTG